MLDHDITKNILLDKTCKSCSFHNKNNNKCEHSVFNNWSSFYEEGDIIDGSLPKEKTCMWWNNIAYDLMTKLRESR